MNRMKKSVATLLLCLICLTAFMSVAAAAEEAAQPTPTSAVDFLKQDGGMLNDQQEVVKRAGQSIVAWLMIVFNILVVVAFLCILLGCLTGITNQMTRAQLKPALLVWGAITFLGNAALSIVYIVQKAGASL